jgi:hypothetical protein
MTEVPAKVAISKQHHSRLMDAMTRMNAVQQSMQMFQSQCEQRLAAIQKEAQQAWVEIAGEYNLDMQNIVWEPSIEGSFVVPTQLRIKQK